MLGLYAPVPGETLSVERTGGAGSFIQRFLRCHVRTSSKMSGEAYSGPLYPSVKEERSRTTRCCLNQPDEDSLLHFDFDVALIMGRTQRSSNSGGSELRVSTRDSHP